MPLSQMRVRDRCKRLGACLLSLLIASFSPALNGLQAPLGTADAAGPDVLKKLSLEELSQIEVTTVAKEPEPAFQTPAAIFVLTREDIRRSGATNLPDLLRLVPGVAVAQIDSAKWAVGIRGFQGRLSKAVQVLIDGRSVYNPMFAGVYWEAQDTLIEDIERIEVVRGPGATIWGSNAVNGVINIITRTAQDTRGTLLSAGGGNVEQGFVSSRYGAGSDRLSYRIYAKAFDRGPQFHPDGRNFDDWRRAMAGFRMDWRTSYRDTLTVQGDAYGTVAGQKLQISTFSPPSITAAEGNAHFHGQNLGATWRRVLDSGANFQVQAYYDRTDRQELTYKEIRNTFDADFIHHLPLSRHNVTWGLGVRSSPSEFIRTTDTVIFRPPKQTYNLFSGFIQDDLAVVPDRLFLTLGTKLEHNTFSGFEIQPTARLAWTPDIRQTLWAAVTRAVRTPSRIEDDFEFNFLADPAVPLYLRLIGDGRFSAEQLIGYEFGYRRFFQPWGFIDVAAFFNRYDDLLSVESRPPFVETSPPPPHLIFPLFFRNGVRADTSGMEIATLWDVGKSWRVQGSYSLVLLDARNKPESNDASTVRQLEGETPRHKVIVQSFFDLPKKFELDLTYRYVSAVPHQNVPSYSTGDVRLGWQFNPRWELSLVGRNLLQPYHVEYAGNPGPLVAIRRGVYLKLTWNTTQQ